MVLFTIVLPAMALAIGVFLFRTLPYEHMPLKERMDKFKSIIVATPESQVVKPSEVLANKPKYANKPLIVRGRVSQDKVVCERVECPANDSCCGCPAKKNLIISDADLPFLSDQPRNLPLFGSNEESLCTRKLGSCDYLCPTWQQGQVYDVEGIFSAETPIAGSGIQIWDFYLEVESNRLVPKTESNGWFQGITSNVQELIKQLKTSGYYVR